MYIKMIIRLGVAIFFLPCFNFEVLNLDVPELVPTNLKKWQFIRNGTALLSKTKGLLFLDCTAKYPIQWKIEGIINPPNIVKMLPYQRQFFAGKVNQTSLFILKMTIDFLIAKNISASSAKCICQSVQDHGIQSYIEVYVPGINAFLKNGEVNKVRDSKVIPCPITDPTIAPVLLFRQSLNGHLDKIENASYDPIKGFVFPHIVEGNYSCNITDPIPESVKIESFITEAGKGIIIHPKTHVVTVFTNDLIIFKCFSLNGNLETQLILEPDVLDPELYSLSSPNNSEINLTGHKRISGSVKCTLQSNETIYWTWNFEFVDPPELNLDNYEGEVACLYNSIDDSVSTSTVQCVNPTHCDYMEHCFQNPAFCNFQKQKQFYGNTKSRCWVQAWNLGKPCTIVPYSHLNGLVQCSIKGLNRRWEFFVSLDFIRYFDWRHANINELVRMDNVQTVLYTNNTSEFVCVATAFLFANSLAFEIEYENGTTQLMDKSLAKSLGRKSVRRIDQFNVLWELKINLTVDAVGMFCHAPWWNSSKTIRVGKSFVTKHLKEPRIYAARESEIFIVGQNNRQLECLADGEPKPKYFWSNDGKEIYDNSEFKIYMGSNGQSILEFLSFEKKLSGNYECSAENSVGKANFKFVVQVEGIIAEGSISFYGPIVGITLSLFFILSLAFIIVFNRYKSAQKLLRSLTENEIDEFFNGRPEFFNSERPTFDTLDLLPYDKNYEIDMNDVQFDSSDVLGSGEFSYVVKGVLKSTGTNVAVKAVKPSADVTLFKSVLSEVKIMIYIGKHDNVVAIIGASTRNIQNRNIYIIMEICDVGSLEKHLRKSRAGFNNLIDNQSINLGLLDTDSSKVSTLDLIRWAGQIAKGMEYLSYKAIIHADLAARNILLTDRFVAKVSDFGLSKKLYECNNYVKKTKSPLPWRWMAPESLSTLTFSTESDIWSYGVTLWEIFTLGDIPFPNENWNKDFILRLTTGMRMGKPKFSTPEIYWKIVGCWDEDATLRPAFTMLRKYFFELSNASNAISEDVDERSKVNSGSVEELDVSDVGEHQRQYRNINADLYGNVSQISYSNFVPSEQPSYANVP